MNDPVMNDPAIDGNTMDDGVSAKPRRRGVVHLAGWLFADLMLVLFVTSFSSIVLAAPPHPVPPHAATPSPSPSRSLMPQKPVLVLNPHVFYIQVDGSALAAHVVSGQVARDIIDQMNGKLDAAGFRNAKAGLIETFGYSPDAPNIGRDEADSINEILTGGIPSFAGALTQSYWNQGDDTQAEVEVFFFE